MLKTIRRIGIGNRSSAHGNEGGTPVREWAVPQGRRVTIIAGVFTELEMEGVPDGGF